MEKRPFRVPQDILICRILCSRTQSTKNNGIQTRNEDIVYPLPFQCLQKIRLPFACNIVSEDQEKGKRYHLIKVLIYMIQKEMIYLYYFLLPHPSKPEKCIALYPKSHNNNSNFFNVQLCVKTTFTFTTSLESLSHVSQTHLVIMSHTQPHQRP